MLKKMINKKIVIMASALFALFLIYLVPKENQYTIQDVKTDIEYVNANLKTEEIYLYNQHHLLSRTKIVNNKSANTKEARIKFAIESLIQDGPNSSQLPSGFQAVLPSEVKLSSLDFQDGLLKLNFSSELLDVNQIDEEHVVEAIVYTATAIDGVNNIIIYVDNDVLTLLPKSKTTLPSLLNRSFGINKEYDFTRPDDVNHVTIYYIDEFNDERYYVPVTKYVNDSRDKINIIIDELTSTNTYQSNLMSFLNSNTKLLETKEVDGVMELDFNQYIFDDSSEENILEEVAYTIALSVKDNYDVDEVVLKVDTKEIYKSVLKTIE